MAYARGVVADFWDGVVRSALASGEPHRTVPSVRRWFGAYRGTGRGAVTTDASPEPYLGPLRVEDGRPRLVALGLNPGRADIRFQGAGGVFAREYEEGGGFSAWAVTEPYLREPWVRAHPRNRYHENLRAFARRWLDDPSVRSRDVLVFELYPWHSDAATAAFSPDADLIEEFIWRPVSEVDVGEVFAIGAAWQRHAERLGLPEQPFELMFTDKTRRARFFELPSSQRLIVTWHQGSNSPPNARDVQALKRALGRPYRPGGETSDPARDRGDGRRPRPRPARQPTRPAGSALYRLFWAQLTDRLDRAQPDWALGAPNRNDYPLLSPLPGARIKCNFSRSGLRVELLLGSTDRDTNVRRLDVLVRHLPDLQLLLGPDAVLKAEPLERRTQARIAVYHPGTIDEQHRWPAFLDWFQTTATDLHHALTTTGAIQVEWPA